MEKLMFFAVYLLVMVSGQDSNIENLFWCDHTDLSDELTDCEKGNLRVDVLRTSSTASTSSSFVDYEEMLLGATRTTCRQVDVYATQLMCKHNVMQDCLSDEYKNLLPNQYNLADAARYLCDNVFELNDQCLMNYMINMGECLLGMGFQNPADVQYSSITEKTCQRYNYASTCVATTFRPCGSTALKIFRKTMDYLKPEACNNGSRLTNSLPLLLFIMMCATILMKVM